MQLLQFRIRAHRALSDSQWLEVRPGINLLETDQQQAAGAIFELLQTIHPLQGEQLTPLSTQTCRTCRESRLNGRTRRIIPAKKSVALAVFSADRETITRIADLDEDLYATDRVEIGRRMDQSRWLNFVEISSSSRWSEVEPTMARFLKELPPTFPQPYLGPLNATMAGLKGSDRLRRGLGERFKDQFRALAPYIPKELQPSYQELLFALERAQRFAAAKEQVYKRLPFFLLVKGHDLIDPDPESPLHLPALQRLHSALAASVKGSGLSTSQLLARLRQRQQQLFPASPQALFVLCQGEIGVASPAQPSGQSPAEQRPTRILQAIILLHHALCEQPPIVLLDAFSCPLQANSEILRALASLAPLTPTTILAALPGRTPNQPLQAPINLIPADQWQP